VCELFGISSDQPVAASRELDIFRLRGGVKADNPDGWGIAWLMNGVFSLVKEPTPAHQSTLFEQLCDTTHSNLVIAHVRKASFPPVINMSNTHPFQRVCCGREWVFAHNGMVPDIVEIESSADNPVCCPTGATDSEYAFCHLLGRIAEQFHGLSFTEPTNWIDNLAEVSGLVASLGKFNFLMSEGEHLIAYGHDRLHHLEHHDPERGDIHRILIATEPLDENEWIAFEPGELRVYREGKMVGHMMTNTMPPSNSKQS
jgi:glutamine amidotransferase